MTEENKNKFRNVTKIANSITQTGKGQSEAWKSAWKLQKEGWTMKATGTAGWNQAQMGLRQIAAGNKKRCQLRIVKCRGAGKQLQIIWNDINLGFVPEKVAAVLMNSQVTAIDSFVEVIDGNELSARIYLKIA